MGEDTIDTVFFTEEKPQKDGLVGTKITVEDYDGEVDAIAYNAIKFAVAAAINKSTPKALREIAVEWLFVPGHVNDEGLNFDLVCRVLGVRPNIIRVRVQYAFYLGNIVLLNPLPFLAVSIPSILELEVLSYAGDEALRAAKYIWEFPGLRADNLTSLMCMDAKEVRALTEKIENKGLVSVMMGHWYFTGRNPQNMSSNNCFHWSRLPV
jgi:hypothetical protein